MAPQSRAYPILLTRPAAQSARFAMVLQRRFVGVNILIAPLIEAVFLQPFVPRRDWAGVIFTSETGAMSARRIAADGTALPELAFCVAAPGIGLFGAIVVADSIAALPISIAGIGVREKSFEFLLKLWYDIAPALSIAASLTGFLIVAGWSIGGVLALPTRHHISREPS